MITIDTFLKWHAQATKQEDGLRLTFPIPVHADLAPLLNNPSLKSIECWWRVTRSIKYSEELAADAQVRLTGYVEEIGERGRQIFHVKTLEILVPKARKKAADIKKEQRSIAKAVGMKAKDLFPSIKKKPTPQLSIGF